jgi:hypothetical protein
VTTDERVGKLEQQIDHFWQAQGQLEGKLNVLTIGLSGLERRLDRVERILEVILKQLERNRAAQARSWADAFAESEANRLEFYGPG